MLKPARIGVEILRARFSAVARSDIERAMASLVAPNRDESNAVDARQELDLKVSGRTNTMPTHGRSST